MGCSQRSTNCNMFSVMLDTIGLVSIGFSGMISGSTVERFCMHIGSPVQYWVKIVYVLKSNTGKRF